MPEIRPVIESQEPSSLLRIVLRKVGSIVEWIGILTLFIFALYGFLLGVLGALDLYQYVPVLARQEVASTTLSILSLVLIYLLWHGGKLDRTDDKTSAGLKDMENGIDRNFAKLTNQLTLSVERITAALPGGPIIDLHTIEETYKYAAERIASARKGVDDVTWGESRQTLQRPEEQAAFAQYLASKDYVCKTSGTVQVPYREVMTFPDVERVDIAKKTMGPEYGAYGLRYYDIHGPDTPPLINFVIIDRAEVILAWYRNPHTLDSKPEIHLAIRHPQFVELFQDYYETIWKRATLSIKEANQIGNVALLDQIRDSIERLGRPYSSLFDE